jgi:hypothetical protein
MSEKTAKPRKRKPAAAKDEAGVLGNLPATRGTRIGGERAERGRSTARTSATTAKPRPKTAKPKATKPKAKTAAPRTAKVTTTKPAPSTPATPAREPATGHRPRPVRAGAPALAESTERARSETPDPREPGAAPPTGTELVTTAIQAAGELAQIGLKVGGQVLKRTVGKLPKP